MRPEFFPTVALTILGVDLLRYLLGAGLVWLVVNVFLRPRLAGRRILDAALRPGQIRHELGYSMSTVAVFAANGARSGCSPRTGSRASMETWQSTAGSGGGPAWA